MIGDGEVFIPNFEVTKRVGACKTEDENTVIMGDNIIISPKLNTDIKAFASAESCLEWCETSFSSLGGVISACEYEILESGRRYDDISEDDVGGRCMAIKELAIVDGNGEENKSCWIFPKGIEYFKIGIEIFIQVIRLLILLRIPYSFLSCQHDGFRFNLMVLDLVSWS